MQFAANCIDASVRFRRAWPVQWGAAGGCSGGETHPCTVHPPSTIAKCSTTFQEGLRFSAAYKEASTCPAINGDYRQARRAALCKQGLNSVADGCGNGYRFVEIFPSDARRAVSTNAALRP